MVEPAFSVQMSMPHQEHLFEHIKQNAPFAKKMIGAMPGEHHGKSLALCGAGFSLRSFVNEHPRFKHDHVWACNSALPYLVDQKVRVTHGMGIDMGLGMLDDWKRIYPVTYLISSSVHPELVQHLRTHNATLRWFHNFLGIPDPEGWTAPDICSACHRVKDSPMHRGEIEHAHEFEPLSYEMYLYQTLFQPSCRPSAGLNVVARAIGVALYQGYNHIRVYGADCAMAPNGPAMPPMSSPEYVEWAKQVIVYADGRTVHDVYGPNGIIVEATGEHFNNRRWHTRADFIITARHLAWMAKLSDGRIELMGDTLPKVMADWTDEHWKQMPDMDGKGAITGFQLHKDYQALVESGDAVLA